MIFYSPVATCNEGLYYYVCQGEELTLTCASKGSALQWNVLVQSPDQQNSNAGFDIIVFQSGNSVSPPRVIMSQTNFSFSITSLRPLVSMMIVNDTTYLNGTRVTCQSSNGTTITTIYVTRNGKDTNCRNIINSLVSLKFEEIIIMLLQLYCINNVCMV